MKNKTTYFRISLTSKCNLSCYFCHNEGQEKNSATDMLSAVDVVYTCSIAQELGYTKFKLTGGEPTLHPEIIEIVIGIAGMGVKDLSMITNGITLKKLAQPLKDAGLHRLNISLYTMDAEKFRQNNGGSERKLQLVFDGIDAAIAAGFEGIKLNYIWDGMENLEDFLRVCAFAAPRDLTIVLLPVMRFSEARDAEQIALQELYALLQTLGIAGEKQIIDNEGLQKRLVTLTNGASILIRDEELHEKRPYERCATCHNQTECREGIFPTRMSAAGELLPCLADGIPGYSIANDLRTRNNDAIVQAFEAISIL